MEKIQERALRFIYDDYSSSYENLPEKSKLPGFALIKFIENQFINFKLLILN
jgi:hypothetical protein